jgi:NAD(P)H-dependent FMN reductase
MLLQVITGTTRQGRFSERVAAWVLERLGDHGGFDVEPVDLRDHPVPLFDDATPPARAGGVYENDHVTQFAATVARADCFLVLTAEYNHGYPAVLKNAMDSTFVEWRRKPISFVGWGNVGGARAVEQLRQVAVEFEMAPLRWAVHILPDVLLPLLRDEDPDDLAVLAPLDPRLNVLADDMAWWMHALATARAAGG